MSPEALERARVVTFALVCLAGPAATAAAQGTGRSMDIDLSIRSAAMGGATNAVFWGDDSDHWGNPATLGYVRGVRYEWGRTQLVPGLADDVLLTSHVLKAGGGGLGFAFSGAPIGVGSVRLDYGASEGTDPEGNPTGTFSSYEQVDSWGFGVNALQLLGSFMELEGADPPPLLQMLEVSGGMSFKEVDIALAPASAGGTGSTHARDAGVLLRVTPVDRFGVDTGLLLRVDLAMGHSRLSYNDDAVVTFLNEDQASRVSRHKRTGYALRASADLPVLHRIMTEPTTRGALARGLSPLLSFGIARDHAEIDAGEGTSGFETDGSGYEVAFANVVALRRGHFRDRLGDIDGATTGWSIALPIGRWGALKYEKARFPQAEGSGLDDLTRRAVTAWLDPVAIWRSVAGRR
jgi:hypothetical protein